MVRKGVDGSSPSEAPTRRSCYGLNRTRLKGHQGARTWTAWGILAYNLDTLAIRTA
jgi:hypothetical protein